MLSSSQLPSRQERQFLTTGGHGLTRMPNDDFCLFLIRVYPWLITPENIKKRRWRGCGRDGARCLSDGRGCRAATPPPVSVSEGGTNVVGLASRGSCPAEDGKAPDCGLRSALSLPIKLRALTIGEIHERPIFRARDEFFSHGIFQNVIGLLPPTFIVPQAMFKEVSLPADTHFLRRPFLPFADNGLQRLARRWKGNQRVQMIWHQ